MDNLESLIESAENRIAESTGTEALAALHTEFLGKKGLLSDLAKKLKTAPPENKAALGKQINEFKTRLNGFFQKQRELLEDEEIEKRMEAEWIDVTLPAGKPNLGSLHPITMVQQDLEDVFLQMGFQVLDGPHIENDYYNFTALNIPEHHPARDMQDTFYFENGLLLRTQTSSIQIRGMEKLKPPMRIVGPGKVFRAERIDASHECVFHQIEGMVVDENISVSNLIYFTQTMISKIFEREATVRLRPGYFPFVEPGFELDIQCQICSGKGCKVCKKVGWIELLGCGMVHPQVLRNGNIDPEKYTGFAFGIGIERLAMNKYGIEDIRSMHNGYLDFARQFSKVE